MEIAPDTRERNFTAANNHADKEHVYQLIGNTFVSVLSAFVKVPEIGRVAKVTYHRDRAIVSTGPVRLGRKIS